MAVRIVIYLEIVDLRDRKLTKVEFHLREAEKILKKTKGLPDEPGNTTEEESGGEWDGVKEVTAVSSGSRQAGMPDERPANYLGLFEFEMI
jgi:hypothetical protein